MRLFSVFSESSSEFKKLSTLAATSMMVALSVAVASLTISIRGFLKIGFSSLPLAVVGAMFGPVAGGFAGIAADLLKFMYYPSTEPFFIGYTLVECLVGIIYGIALYKKPVKLPRVMAVRAIITLFINLGANSYFLYLTRGYALIAMMPMRILKNVLLYPVEVAMLYMLLKIVSRARISMRRPHA